MDNFEFENKKKKRLRREPFYIVLCLLGLVIGSFGGYFLKTFQVNQSANVNTSLYEQIVNVIESDFLDVTESKDSFQERMLYGMIAGLGDPYTSYMTAQEAQNLNTAINGSVQGIGITFSALSAGGLVLEVYEGTPAQAAGLLAGDLITHVEKTAIAGYTAEKVKDMVTGASGTDVALTVLRNGKSIDIVAKRASVETSVSYEVRQNGAKAYGYLRLTTFGEATQTYVEKALQAFQKAKVDTIVIDLRGNGGGYLTAAQDILDLFIEKNKVLLSTQSASGQKQVYKATGRDKYSFQNGYILTDGNTASASEVMIGALKEHLNYQLIGRKTFGKGIVQSQKTLSDSSVLKYTSSKWLTPSEECINGKGFEPDHQVKVTTLNDFQMNDFKKTYRYDQVSVDIQNMQTILKALGYKVDRTDGYFSKATQTALQAFEKAYGLKVDGLYQPTDAVIVLNALTFHIYQQLPDQDILKVQSLIK